MSIFKKSHRFIKLNKKILKIILVSVGVSFLVLGAYEFKKQSNDEQNSKAQEIKISEYNEYVKVAEAIPTTNKDGTPNGINLALISSLNESYIKDWLTIAKDNYDGKYNDEPVHSSIRFLIGVQLTESEYGYEATGIPASHLPWNESERRVVWNESVQGYPKEALTLSQANMNVFSGQYGHGKVTPYWKADATRNGGYGVWQITGPVFESPYIYFRAKINGYNSDSNRARDKTYFPDQLYFIDQIRNEATSQARADGTVLTDDEADVLQMSYYASGSVKDIICNKTGSQARDLTKAVVDDLKKVKNKYGDVINDKAFNQSPEACMTFCQTPLHIAVITALIEDCGWELTRYTNSAFTTSGYKTIHPEASDADAYAFAQSHLVTPLKSPAVVMNYFCDVQKKVGSEVIALNSTQLGHMYAVLFLAEYQYGNLLKMAGLSTVDPTKPETYLNLIPETEWKPGTELSDIQNKTGIDISKYNDKQAKVVTEGYLLLGVPYCQTRPVLYFAPPKLDDGTYSKEYNLPIDYSTPGVFVNSGGLGAIRYSLDCSSFCWYVYHQVFNIDLGIPNTYGLLASSELQSVDINNLQPGDLIFPHAGHVEMYIGTDSNGTKWTIGEHDFGDVCRIAEYRRGIAFAKRPNIMN